MIVRGIRLFRGYVGYALILSVFVFASVFQPATPVSALTNPTVNFQGRLLNAQGAVVPDGFYNIQFKIYQDGTGAAVGNPGGTLKWTENWTNAAGKGVMVKNGYMSVELGTVNPFGTQVDWNQSTLWLSMNIGNTNASCTPITSCALDGEMVPMKRLSSSPYAMNSNALGGMTAAQFLQLAQGVQLESGNSTNSVSINKTGTGGNFINLQSNGIDVFNLTSTGDLLFGNNANHSISMASTASGTGKNLTVSAGASAAGNGGVVQIVGGAAGTAGNGGGILLSGGAGAGGGTQGLVSIGASSYLAATNAICAVDCTVDQNYVDSYSTVIVNASTPDISITLPAPSITTTGRILYVTTSSGSQDFNLAANSGANLLNVTMKQNTTATMIWNGTAWTPGGASNAITLQATYNNGTNPSETPEIKLDSIRGSIDIQDSDISIGAGQDILAVHASNSTGLGTTLFGVSTEGRVTIQGTTDTSSAFRVLNSGGQYTFNINSANGYTISNSVKSVDNAISNPGFEAGAGNTDALQKGEEGWFDSTYTQGSISNSAATAHNGNYSLQITPNNTAINVYAGTYYEVQPGEGLYAEAYMKAGAGANGYGGVLISWYNKDKTKIGDSGFDGQIYGSSASSWSIVTASATAPAGTSYARISAVVDATASIGPYYFDDFYMVRNQERSDKTYRNSVNSTAAFQVQSAAGSNTLLRADTTNNIVKVGDSTGSDTDTTVLVLDSSASDPTTLANKNGGLFYNSTTNNLKAVINGTVVDICTTAVTCQGYSASAGSTIALQASTPGTTQNGNFNISGTGILSSLKSHDNEALIIRTGNGTGGAASGNLTLDVGTTSGGALGNIIIGRSNVATTMAGYLAVGGSSVGGAPTISLGTANAVQGSIAFKNAAGSNTVTLRAPNSNPLDSTGTTASDYTLSLPTKMGEAGTCLKTMATGELYFQGCGVGLNVNLQDVYDNSATPATIMLANSKDFVISATDTANDPNILMNLKCVTSCGSNGRFAVQNNGVDVFTVTPSGDIALSGDTKIGSGASSDANLTLLNLDNYNGATESASCGAGNNQGAIYYNTNMGSIRGCVGNSWTDISNPDTLGLLTFGVLPSSGGTGNAYDLPALTVPGASGPCKVSRTQNNELHINQCVAYSSGRRMNVPDSYLCIISNTANCTRTALPITNTSTWYAHICLDTDGAAVWQGGVAASTSTSTATLPPFSVTQPTLCLAEVKVTNNIVDDLYDIRTFSSASKEAVNAGTAVDIGMLADAGTNGSMKPSASSSQKLYGAVIVVDPTTPTSTGAPNVIVTTSGPAWVKANAGTAGAFVISSTTAGFATTNASIPNNSFYYSAGNTRTSYSTTCTAINNCSGSLYVNFIVR